MIAKLWCQHFAPRKQRGSALVLALFLIVVMSLLITSLIKMLSATDESIAVEVYGARALLAASTGVEKMLSEIFPLNSTATDTESVAANSCAGLGIANPYTFTLPTAANLGMSSCSFTVVCYDQVVDVTLTESVRYYRVESTGNCNVGDWQTSRKIVIEAKALNYE